VVGQDFNNKKGSMGPDLESRFSDLAILTHVRANNSELKPQDRHNLPAVITSIYPKTLIRKYLKNFRDQQVYINKFIVVI